MTGILDSLAKPPPEPSELDLIMSRDPLDLSAQDIDAIIAYQRQQRARREAGGKTRRAAADGPKPTISLASLGIGPAPKPAPTVPSKPGGFRRI